MLIRRLLSLTVVVGVAGTLAACPDRQDRVDPATDPAVAPPTAAPPPAAPPVTTPMPPATDSPMINDTLAPGAPRTPGAPGTTPGAPGQP